MVIDACAMIAYLEDENGADVVENILTDRKNDCIAHEVNIGELYTYYLKYFTESDADEAVRLMTFDAGVRPQDPRDSLGVVFWKAVARHRGRITSTVKNPTTGACHSIALADCFALALALRETGTVVTCDAEFTYVRDSGLCPVLFFRPPGSPRR
jgi:uncharacterized protein with PIN domain